MCPKSFGCTLYCVSVSHFIIIIRGDCSLLGLQTMMYLSVYIGCVCFVYQLF